MMKAKHLLTVFSVLLLLSEPSRATQGAQAFTLSGTLLQVDNSEALLDSAAKIKISILDPSKNCLLYEEEQTVNTSATNGYYSIRVGSHTSGSTSRTTSDSGNSMSQVYQNSVAVVAKNAPGQTCAGAQYTPANRDGRYLRLTVTPSATGLADVLTPDIEISSVPQAMVAETLQGYSPNQFLVLGNGDLSQTNLQNVFASGNTAKLLDLVGGTSNQYARGAANNTLPLPAASSPASPQAGQLWYDAGTIKFYDGSSTQTLGISGAGITSLVAGTGLNVGAGPGGTITTSGTLNINVGSTANKIVQLDGSAKLPAVDGSLLTNVVASSIGSSVSLSTTGDISAQNLSATGANFRSITLTNGSAQTMFLQPPVSITGSPTFTLPGTAGNANEFLKTDGSGNLSWGAPSTALASANIWVGSAGGVATAQAPSGDIAMTNAGVFTVNGVKGKTVSAAPTLTGQLLRYDGTNWTPNFVAMTDLRSSVTGSNSFASSCLSNQTLTYNSVGDVMSCQNISISNSQVSGLGTAATLNAGTAASNLVQLDGSANLPAVNGSALTNLNASNISSGTLNAAQLPSTVILNGGNSFGAASSIGNNDNFDLNIKTNNLNRMTVLADGNVGIGTTAPMQRLDISGKIALDGTVIAYRPTTMTGTLVLGDGGASLSHTAGNEGYNNTFVGIGAGFANTTGYYNTASGYWALYANTTGNYNAANGYFASRYNTTGNYNTASGSWALYTNTTGNGNTADGNGALLSNTTGGYNTANGANALWSNTTGNNNSASGVNALFSNTTGSSNIASGPNAGHYIADGVTALTTVNNSIFLGNNSKALANNGTNEIVIGSTAIGEGSNSVVLGNDSITKTVLKGNVGIGTTNPTAKLQVSGQIVSSVYNAGSSLVIDWNNGNNQYTAPPGNACAAMALTNLQDGGIYRLAVQGVTSGICDFSQAGLTFVYTPNRVNVASDAVYTFSRMGTTVYVSWLTGFSSGSTTMPAAHTTYVSSTGTVSASSYWNDGSGQTYPWEAFDSSLANGPYEGWSASNTLLPHWLKYQFNVPTLVGRYKILRYYTASDFSPTAWVFQGSNDDANWTNLDSRSGQTGWSTTVEREFSFSNTTPYTYYRIYITNDNGAGYTGVAELTLFPN